MYTFAISTASKNMFTLSIYAKDVSHAIKRVQELSEGMPFKIVS